MSRGLYSGIDAMTSAERRLSVLADNLANLSTTAYKRSESFTQALERTPGDPRHRVLRTRSLTDFSQGNLRNTGQQLDFALTGEGFFALEGARGEVYTRNGAFHLSPDGVLQTRAGLPVAWDQKQAPLDPTGQRILVDGDGQVRQGTTEVGRLRVVNFEEPERLALGADGNWQAPRRLPRATHTATVHQGALEDSNANATDEMIEMVVLQRTYEAAAAVVDSIDQTYQRLYQPR